ncbi:MAG: UDP-N-acetylmuramoyl-tripeptide--D-alanyl-D-alanine ligase [Microscillaceae bacterium]|jgi:UDP-N-acetylmuramoyl-tripeptide--D-alanyl-D-alanine ligase|nr:UDP-N-acetylmuramoyl-tripeptide--D-alanyl-D-alanine ligase [Microscillaceae bacterium]
MKISLEQLFECFETSGGISTDTRKIQPDCLFFALKGANFNGNLFAEEALQKGAKWVVVDELALNPAFYTAHNQQVIEVDDVLSTLQKLANYYRLKFSIPIIAVGGSNGKTTTKELIARVLAQKFRTFATPGNLNNHIGVPLTLLQMPTDTEIAVIEIGANHAGEIAELCQIVAPNYGIITNIGLDHLEGFGSIEGVARANGELFDYLAKHGGKAFVHTQEDFLLDIAQSVTEKITYPQVSDYFSAQLLPSDFYVKYQTEAQEVVDTQLFGAYNFANIAAALCIGKYFGVESSLANQAASTYIPANQRSQIIQKGTNTIILDAYNANPSSMQLAIQNFALIKAENKLLILGDMFELGEASDQEHQKIGELLAKYNFDTLVLFGQAMQNALAANPKAYYFTDKFSLHNWLQDRQLAHTHILIKGSRGVSLETTLHFI